jgi:hypothetical protein
MKTKRCFEHRQRTACRTRKAFFIPIVVVGIFILSGGVMLLWNAVLPLAVTGVHTITFWQAMGILVLSRILFGGFKGWHDHGHPHHRHHQMERDLREKWMQMDPHEREKMRDELKNEWKQRFGHTVKPE